MNRRPVHAAAVGARRGRAVQRRGDDLARDPGGVAHQVALRAVVQADLTFRHAPDVLVAGDHLAAELDLHVGGLAKGALHHAAGLGHEHLERAAPGEALGHGGIEQGEGGEVKGRGAQGVDLRRLALSDGDRPAEAGSHGLHLAAGAVVADRRAEVAAAQAAEALLVGVGLPGDGEGELGERLHEPQLAGVRGQVVDLEIAVPDDLTIDGEQVTEGDGLRGLSGG